MPKKWNCWTKSIDVYLFQSQKVNIGSRLNIKSLRLKLGRPLVAQRLNEYLTQKHPNRVNVWMFGWCLNRRYRLIRSQASGENADSSGSQG